MRRRRLYVLGAGTHSIDLTGMVELSLSARVGLPQFGARSMPRRCPSSSMDDFSMKQAVCCLIAARV